MASNIKLSYASGKWSRTEVANNPRRLYVFTDNTDRDSGKGVIDRGSDYYKKYGDGQKDLHYPATTAAVIRGLDNAFPVSTQRWYHAGAKGDSGRWNDVDIDEFRRIISDEFSAIREALASGQYDEVVFPDGGLFAGTISQLTEERTPALYAALKEEFDSFVKFIEEFKRGEPVQARNGNVESAEQDSVSELRRGLELNDWFGNLPISARVKVLDSDCVGAIIPGIRAKGEEASSELDFALDDISSNLSGNWQERLSTDEINHVLGDLFTSLPLMVKEALRDSFVQLYTNGKEQQRIESAASISQALDNSTDYDVIMVGIGKRDLKDVMELFPNGTDYVVDARRSGRNYHDWRLNEARLIPFLKDMGIEHVSRNAALSFTSNYKMDKIEEDEKVQTAIGKIVDAADEGRRIVILYDEGSPYKGTSAIGLGQALSRAGLEVGYRSKYGEHINTVSHQSVILGILNRSTLLGGRVEQIHFTADGKYTLEEGVELQERHVEERRIRGRWNYGRGFNYDGQEVQPVITDMDYSANRSMLAQNTGDITFKFVIGDDAKKKYPKKGHIIVVPVDLDGTQLNDPAYARMKAAECYAQIQSFVKWKVAHSHNFNPEKLCVTSFGPNETEYSVKRVSRAATERDLRLLNLSEEGVKDEFSLSDNDHPSNDRYNYNMLKEQTDLPEDSYELTGVTEDHWTKFFTNFFAAVNEGLSAHQYDTEQQKTGQGPEIDYHALENESEDILFDDAISMVSNGADDEQIRKLVDEFDAAAYHRLPYHIGTVVTDCTPGADKAALLAAQSLDLGFYPVMAKNMETYVNTAMTPGVMPSSIKMKEAQTVYAKTAMVTTELDTYLRVPKGQSEAYLFNSFHLGLKEQNERQVSIDHDALLAESNIKEQIDAPGLTPRQVLSLQILGYSNGDIRLMVDAAVNDSLRISSARDMLDFLWMCNEQFFLSDSSSLPDEAKILDAFIKADQQTESSIREDGESFVTFNELAYPASLKGWTGYYRTVTEIVPSQVVDTVEIVRDEPTDEHDSGVAHIEYDFYTTKEEVKRSKVDEHSPAVLHYKGDLSVFERPTMAILGHEQAQSPSQAAAVIGKRLASNEVVLVSSLSNGSNMTAIRSALDNGGRVALVSPRPLDAEQDQELIEEVVRKGGCVVSELAHDADMLRPLAEERANHMMAVLGKHLLVLDSKLKDNLTSDSREAAALIKDASDGVSVINYGDTGKESVRLRANAELISKYGALSVKPDGDGLAPIIRKAQLLSPQWVEDTAQRAQEERREAVKGKTAKRERLRTVPFSVVRSGNRQVFVVHPSLDYVREAVKDNYGEKVVFADSVNQAMDMLSGVPVRVNGKVIDTFHGWEGTQPMVDLPYVSYLLLHDDVVYSVSNAPESAIGVPLPERQVHLEALRYFKERAMELSRTLNESVGLDGMPVMRFGLGRYVSITPNGVDVYEGSGEAADADRLLGSVFLSSKGRLTVVVNDYDLHLDSVQRFNDEVFSKTGTINIDVFQDPERRLSAIRSAVEPLVQSLANSLLSSSQKESDEYALATREEHDEIDKTIESNYRESSSVNSDLIVPSVFKALGHIIAQPANDEPVNRAKMIAKVNMSLAPYVKKLNQLQSTKAKVEKEYVSVVHKLMTVNAEEEGNHIQISDTAKELESRKTSLEAEINQVLSAIEHLEYDKYLIANAERVFLADSPAMKSIIGLCVDGRLINLKDVMVHASEIDAAASELTGLKEESQKEKLTFENMNSKVEGFSRSDSISDVKARSRARRQSNLENKQAFSEEIVAETKRGYLYVIQREGLFAIAGKNLVIRSTFYPEMSIMGDSQRFLVKMENGKYNILNSQGNKLITGGYDEIRPEVDHVSVVRDNDKWNHIDFRSGGQLISFWEAEARDFHEGWAAIKGDENEDANQGKWNFVNKNGDLLSDVWFDNVKDFSDGRAECQLGDNVILLDTDGNEINLIPIEDNSEDNDFSID